MRRGARGRFGKEAAVELLIAHGFWLQHAGLVAAAVVSVDDVADAAALDWPAAVDALAHRRFVCSCGQGQVLRIAASLAADLPVSLGWAVCCLDEQAAAAVAAAVLHAAGWGQRLPAAGRVGTRVGTPVGGAVEGGVPQ